MTETDDALASWDDVRDDFKPSALLVGNGLSINLWAGFSYASLFDRADFGVSAAEVFAALATSNFEAVLECVHHARLVLQAQGQPTSEVDALYERSAMLCSARSARRTCPGVGSRSRPTRGSRSSSTRTPRSSQPTTTCVCTGHNSRAKSL